MNFTEVGENKGQVVEGFQKAVDGKAQGEPWCMAFVQFCLKQVDALARTMDWVTPPDGGNLLFHSESCWETWTRSPDFCRSYHPFPGAIAIWRNVNNTSGHTGIVTKLGAKEGEFHTIEGNTSDSSLADQREGDGVFMKLRKGHLSSSLRLMGFLNPWPK